MLHRGPEMIPNQLRLIAGFILLAALIAAQEHPRKQAQDEVTFNRDVAPIIFQNCSTCHRPGEAGPFPLLSYQDVKSHARQIVDVTRTRFMPPWLPAAGGYKFEQERRL